MPAAQLTEGGSARVEFVDCNRDDLCMSFADFERKAEKHKPKAAPRDVFAYVIHEGKVRAPAAAMALIERVD